MKSLPLLFLSLALSFASGVGAANRVGDFTLLDHQGRSHQMSWYGDHKAIVLLIQANGDQAVRDTALRLKNVRDEFEPQGVVFFMLNPLGEDDRAAIAQEAQQPGYDLPILLDEAQLVAESLGVSRTAQTLVIDPATMTVVFRGALDEVAAQGGSAAAPGKNYLTDALTALLAGESLAADVPAAVGALIDFPGRSLDGSSISYAQDIVPILKDNCVTCHHDGAIAPWSMSSHAMIKGWSPMMREVLMTRRMPPGQIDLHLSKPMEGVAGLSVREQQLLIHWINAGSPRNKEGEDGAGAEDPLAALTFDDPKFTLGEPDLIYKVPAQGIPATGVVDYRYVPVELNLDRDVWVRAMEFVPGDRAVLHHIIAYLSSPADKTANGRDNGSPQGESVSGFAPGRQPDTFRDNSGRLIRKGSNLLLQMHYTTSGRETVDETEVGIYLYDQPPTYVMSGGVAGQRRFLIPANVKEHQLEGEQLIERDAYLYSMTPHMHFRGKYMSYTAAYPDGTSEVLLSVPRYDFNWQFSYELKEPVFLPAGTRLIVKGAMDNSDRNPRNPDPSRPVHFGLQTKHEMFFGFTTFRYVGDTPQSLTGGGALHAKAVGLGLSSQ
ncbi:MAG: redoxin domain-containing protein [Proteobacteria bacterium]|nr:redoxin domain-containing protein [Pseudomonadota bacterium]